MQRFRGLTQAGAPGAGGSLAGMGASVLVHGVLAVIVIYGGLAEPADPEADSPWSRVIFLAPYASTPSELRMERVSYVALDRMQEGEGGAMEAGGGPDSDADMFAREALDLAAAEDAEAAGSTANDEEIYMESQVEDPAAYDELSAAPHYPDSLRRQNIEGLAIVEFVVDSRGRADTLTFRVLEASHRDFGLAVREALPRMRFSPATVNGLPVQQFVQIPFIFRIRTAADTLPDTSATNPPPGDLPDTAAVTGSGW